MSGRQANKRVFISSQGANIEHTCMLIPVSLPLDHVEGRGVRTHARLDDTVARAEGKREPRRILPCRPCRNTTLRSQEECSNLSRRDTTGRAFRAPGCAGRLSPSRPSLALRTTETGLDSNMKRVAQYSARRPRHTHHKAVLPVQVRTKVACVGKSLGSLPVILTNNRDCPRPVGRTDIIVPYKAIPARGSRRTPFQDNRELV